MDYSESEASLFIESGFASPIYDGDGNIVRPWNSISSPEIVYDISHVGGIFECAIRFVIKHPIESRNIDAWYKKNKGIILSISNDFFSGYINPVRKIDNLEKILLAIKLREKDKLTFAEIADKICEDYPDEPDVIDGKVNETSVRQLYSRHKKLFKRDAV